MQRILETLNLTPRLSQAAKLAGMATEPLDHPCLRGVDRAFIDDLPLPAYVVISDGSIKLVDGT